MSIEKLEEALKDESGIAFYEYVCPLDWADVVADILALIEKQRLNVVDDAAIAKIVLDTDKRDRLDRYVCAAMSNSNVGFESYERALTVVGEVMAAVDKHLEQSK
jgi:hypothetical protein